MYDMREFGWVPPTLIPREGGYDVSRPQTDVQSRPPMVCDRFGNVIPATKGNGGLRVYPFEELSPGDWFVIHRINGIPELKSFRSYASRKGAKKGKQFSVEKLDDVKVKVLRIK